MASIHDALYFTWRRDKLYRQFVSPEINVKLAGLAFPRLCPSCGQIGTVSVPRQKFVRAGGDEEEPTDRVFSHAPWFCASCAARHHRELRRPTPLEMFKRLFTNPGLAGGGIFVFIIGLFFLKDAFLKLSPLLAAVALFPLGIGASLLRQSWNLNAGRYLPPPTSVTESFDFSSDRSAEFEPPWASFSFARPEVAEAFRALNAGRLWSAASGEAMAARQKRAWADKKRKWLTRAAIAAVCLYALLAWLFNWN
jgi:hypothetical protein